MNSSQKLGMFLLIVISITYVYFSFFGKDFKFPQINHGHNETPVYNPVEEPKISDDKADEKNGKKIIKIFVLDNSGSLRSLRRECDLSIENSCFEFAIKELIKAPTKWEKSKGYTSEIPAGTKLISVRESQGNILVDLSSDFETGGGAESTYMRIKQVIKTVNSNSNAPVYLYINGKQANVIGGEGVMLKQPLNDKSLDD